MAHCWKPINIFAIILALFAVSDAQKRLNVFITSIIMEPYLMHKPSNQYYSTNGNEKYEGLVKDLADELSKKAHFDYTLNLVRDGKFGGQTREGVWNGMIGELVRENAEIVIAPLTVTKERQDVIDFTSPFMDFQLSILLKHPLAKSHSEVEDDELETGPVDENSFQRSPYMFLRPFSLYLWLSSIASLIILAFLTHVIELFVPRKQGQVVQTTIHEHGVIGSPRTASGRLLQIIFWIFVIILIASYIAKFTSNRLVDRIHLEFEQDLPIETLSDLLGQNQLEFGTILAGSTFAFFKNSWDRLYRKLWSDMVQGSNFVRSVKEGVERVRNGSYAFIMEEPFANYEALHSDCNLVVAPNAFGPKKFFAVGVRRSSSDGTLKNLRDRINVAILKMRENGELDVLIKKWFEWNKNNTCESLGTNSNEPIKTIKDADDDPLCVSNMAGLFYILLAAILVGILIAVFEIVRKNKSLKKRTQPTSAELHDSIHHSKGADRH